MKLIIEKKAKLPKGFLASGLHCGLKRRGKLDLALLYSALEAQAACVFTTNKIKAAPVLVNQQHLKSSDAFRAVVINSANANCFTGKQGMNDANRTVNDLANILGVKKQQVLIASTGIIGKRLAVSKITRSLPDLVNGLSRTGIHKAKRAILTTDTCAKEVSAAFMYNNRTITLCAIAKGAGMIAPRMATMLAFVLTDAAITRRALDKALNTCVGSSFNSITIDGCMSTNDTVCVLANVASGNSVIDVGRGFDNFLCALSEVCGQLARMIVLDAEGATKFITVTVKDAKSYEDAKKVALSIANSVLFKTAMYGENPNVGRVIQAVGASGVALRKTPAVTMGRLTGKDINVEVSLKEGRQRATVFTCDLSPEYVKINAGYN